MEKSFSQRLAEAREVVTFVSAQEAANLRNGCEPVIFVDPRGEQAARESTGIIPGAVNVSLDELSSGQLPAALTDKWAPIITTCQGGPMGAVAAHELKKLGFKRVTYIRGGTQEWVDAGLPTER